MHVGAAVRTGDASETPAGPAGGRDNGPLGVGAEVRARRIRRGISAVALAREAGVSPSLISQVERGVTRPSLEALWAIARALGAPMGAFFQEEDEDRRGPAGPPPRLVNAPMPSEPRRTIVVRADARKRLGLPNSVTYDLLSPDLQHQIEFIWAAFEPGEESPRQPYVHAGEEQMVVIEGEIHFWVDGDEFVLGTGDSITLDSSRPHRAANLGERRAVVIAAITPPSF